MWVVRGEYPIPTKPIAIVRSGPVPVEQEKKQTEKRERLHVRECGVRQKSITTKGEA